MRRTALISGEPHILQGKAHIPLDLLRRISQVGRPEGDVLVNRWGKELVVRVLEDHSHCPAHGPQACCIILQWVAGKENRARCRPQDTVHHQHKGGLARPVGPHQGHLPSRLEGDTHIFQGLGTVSIGVAQIPGLYDAGHAAQSRDGSLHKTAMLDARARYAPTASICRPVAFPACSIMSSLPS